MLYKCTGAIGKKLNKKMEEKPIEGFTNCCPDGMTMVNGQCIEVCQNCKYNDCNFGSSNLGDFYSRPFDGKKVKTLMMIEKYSIMSSLMFQITNDDNNYIGHNFYIVSIKGKMYSRTNII